MADVTPVLYDSLQGNVNVSNYPDVLLASDVACLESTVVAISATDGEIGPVGSNPNRRGLILFNDTNCDVLLKYGSGVSTNLFTVKIGKGVQWLMPFPVYTGAIFLYFESSTGESQLANPALVNGSAMITELSLSE